MTATAARAVLCPAHATGLGVLATVRARVGRLLARRNLEPVADTARGPRQARLDGFDLHANVWVPLAIVPASSGSPATSSAPLAQDRLRLRADGRTLVELTTVWRDGTSHFLFEPVEFLEKLAALIPRPAINSADSRTRPG